MRFVLAEIDGDKVRLTTRTTGKSFWTNAKDLIFIESKYNKQKSKRLRKLNTAILTNNWVEPIDLNPENTAKIVSVLKSDEVPY